MNNNPKDMYLLLRVNVWWYYRKIPKPLRGELGMFYRVSLDTTDKYIARRKRDIENAEFQRVIAKTGGEDSFLIELAKSRRNDPEAVSSELFFEVAEEHVSKNPGKVSTEEWRAAQGIAESVFEDKLLSELLPAYLKEITEDLTKQTIDEKKRHLEEYKKWLKHDLPLSKLIDQKRAFDYLNTYLLPSDNHSSTKQKKLRNIDAFFKWCGSRGYCYSNPFSGLQVKTVRGKKGGSKKNRRAWKDDELSVLFDGLAKDAISANMKSARNNARKLIAMSTIAAYSGMRIGEICGLRVNEDVTDDVFSIHEGKNDSAVRIVPMHPVIRPLVKSLVEHSTDGYLISELSPGGPDGKRMWHIQKAFGRRKTALGFGSELVFHSFRSSFITKLKHAGVPIILLKETVGHTIDDITVGHYGEDMLIKDKQDAVNKVSYEVDLLSYVAKINS